MVPGTVKLLETVHRRYGHLPWARLFQRAIALAERGFPISPRLHALVRAETHWVQPRARDYFTAGGSARPVGARLTNPAYATTLRTLAAHGAKAFYAGPIADDVVRTGGHHPPAKGQTLHLAPRPGSVHLFDLDTGRTFHRATTGTQ